MQAKFWRINSSDRTLERLFVTFNHRILSYYIDDPQFQQIMIINNHECIIKTLSEDNILRYCLCITKNNKSIIEFYHNDLNIIILWKQKLQECSLNNLFYNKYKLISDISKKNQDSRIVKIQCMSTLNIYVAKIIRTNQSEYFQNHIAQIVNELYILKNLNHSGIVKLYEAYQENNYIAIVLEYCPGGDLTQRIIKHKCYTEKNAAKLMFNLFNILNYLQTKNIIHKDIKPDNILLLNNDDDTTIKLADFGLSSSLYSGRLNDRCDTIGYLAPEIFQCIDLTNKVDIYSCGLVLYYILIGEPLFDHKNIKHQMKISKERIISFDNPKWRSLSKEARNFIKALLAVNPNERIPLEECLKSEWIQKNLGSVTPDHPSDHMSNSQSRLHNHHIPEISLFATVAMDSIKKLQSITPKASIETKCTVSNLGHKSPENLDIFSSSNEATDKSIKRRLLLEEKVEKIGVFNNTKHDTDFEDTPISIMPRRNLLRSYLSKSFSDRNIMRSSSQSRSYNINNVYSVIDYHPSIDENIMQRSIK